MNLKQNEETDAFKEISLIYSFVIASLLNNVEQKFQPIHINN